MSLMPTDARYFINSWTWGYEEILKAIASAFCARIHVDRYKYEIYTHLSDPFLKALVTRDPDATRFHACERFDRCKRVRKNDPTVVYVNPVNMSRAKWDIYYAETKGRLERGEVVSHLVRRILLYFHRVRLMPSRISARPTRETFAASRASGIRERIPP